MIIVVDLDRTLLSKDSFPAWVFFILRQASTSNPLLFLHILTLLGLRAFGIINHLTFKKKLMILLDKNDWNELFGKHMSNFTRGKVIELMKKHDEATYVLSTAAPIQYVQYLARLLPIQFDFVFASRIIDMELYDNSGVSKVISFENVYKNAKCDLFITDHYQDIPMMKFSARTILVNPSKETLTLVNSNAISSEVLWA